MNKTCLVSFLVGLAALTLPAQTPQNAVPPAARGVISTPTGDLSAVRLQVLTGGVLINPAQPVQGHPFSATEENTTVQTLANGTRIESKQTSKQYRDYDGRTRTEAADGTIVITDPVAGVRITLSPRAKSALKTDLPAQGGRGARSGGPVVVVGGAAGQGRGGGGRGSAPTSGEAKEDLGVRAVNGVAAHGERVTVTIPKGEIGNDRELKVVTERWTSDDLQMLIKSVNSDPRYGDTTYEMTGIQLAAPDPTLFQIPADYSLLQGGRGATAVAPPPDTPGARGGARGGKQ